jgi:hypothetical protein
VNRTPLLEAHVRLRVLAIRDGGADFAEQGFRGLVAWDLDETVVDDSDERRQPSVGELLVAALLPTLEQHRAVAEGGRRWPRRMALGLFVDVSWSIPMPLPSAMRSSSSTKSSVWVGGRDPQNTIQSHFWLILKLKN